MSVGCLYDRLGDVSEQVLRSFFNWIVRFLLLLSCMRSLYVWTVTLAEWLSANIFSHVFGFLLFCWAGQELPSWCALTRVLSRVLFPFPALGFGQIHGSLSDRGP